MTQLEESAVFGGQTLIKRGHDGRINLILGEDPSRRFKGVKLSARPGSESETKLLALLTHEQLLMLTSGPGQQPKWHQSPAPVSEELTRIGMDPSGAEVAYLRRDETQIEVRVRTGSFQVSALLSIDTDITLQPLDMLDHRGVVSEVPEALYPVLLSTVRTTSSHPGQLIYLTGTRGGVGVSSYAWMMASLAARQESQSSRSRPVYLIEANFQSPKLASRLRLIDDRVDLSRLVDLLHRASSEGGALDEAQLCKSFATCTHTTADGLRVIALPAESGASKSWLRAAALRAISWALSQGSIVFVDGGILTSSSDSFDQNATAEADRVVLLSYPQEGEEDLTGDPNIGDALRAAHKLTSPRDQGGLGLSQDKLDIVLNRCSGAELASTSPHLEPYRLLGAVPSISSLERRWVGLVDPDDAYSAEQLAQMGTRLIMEASPAEPTRDFLNRIGVSSDRQVLLRKAVSKDTQVMLARKLDVGMRIRTAAGVVRVEGIELRNGDRGPEIVLQTSAGTAVLLATDDVEISE